MRSLVLLCVAGLLGTSSLALANTNPAGSTPQTKEQKICRETAPKTGSRMSSGRKCKTAAEWAEIDANTKDVRVEQSQVGTINRGN